MAEKFTADIITLAMPSVDGYDCPTGIVLSPPHGNPQIITGTAGHHAQLYDSYAAQFPELVTDGSAFPTDPNLIALGWRNSTDTHPVIVPHFNYVPKERLTIAMLAACALSHTLAHDIALAHADGIPRTMRFPVTTLYDIATLHQSLGAYTHLLP